MRRTIKPIHYGTHALQEVAPHIGDENLGNSEQIGENFVEMLLDHTQKTKMVDVDKEFAAEARRTRDPFCNTENPLRIARVEQLAILYAERMEQEISPFDDGSADLDKFLAPWEY